MAHMGGGPLVPSSRGSMQPNLVHHLVHADGREKKLTYGGHLPQREPMPCHGGEIPIRKWAKIPKCEFKKTHFSDGSGRRFLYFGNIKIYVPGRLSIRFGSRAA